MLEDVVTLSSSVNRVFDGSSGIVNLFDSDGMIIIRFAFDGTISSQILLTSRIPYDG